MGFSHRSGVSEHIREESVPDETVWMFLTCVNRALSLIDGAQLRGSLGMSISTFL